MKIERFTLAIPGGLSIDEADLYISNVRGSETHLTDSQYTAYTSGLDKEKSEVRELIEPYYSQFKQSNTPNSNKKLSELLDLGKFIHQLKLITGSDMRLDRCDEIMIPDFVISNNGKLIGVEHTTLVDDDVIIEISKLESCLINVREILLKSDSTITGIFNLYISSDTPLMHDPNLKNFTNSQRDAFVKKRTELPYVLADYILSLDKNEDVIKPDFIDKIVKVNDVGVDLRLSERYFLKNLTKNNLEKCISKKEKKVVNYKEASGLNYCWLLIVIEDLSSKASFEIIQENLPTGQNSSFDNIFIFKNFSKEIFCSYKE